MPEFKLEALKHVKGRPIPPSIPTKNEYCEKVKMPEWFTSREAEPKDNNPYSPPGGNMFLSTYKRLGNSPETDNFVTTTKLMLEQVKLKETLNFKLAKRPLVSYEELKKTCTPIRSVNCPKFCAPDFISTMKDNYQPPYPCVMKPLIAPKIPFLQNRKLIQESPDMSDDKFYDDSFSANVKHLQEIKSARWISYNPMTRAYSDGSPGKTIRRKCYELPY